MMEILLFPQLGDNLNSVSTLGKGLYWMFSIFCAPNVFIAHPGPLAVRSAAGWGSPRGDFHLEGVVPTSEGIRDQGQGSKKRWQGNSRCPGSLLDHGHG